MTAAEWIAAARTSGINVILDPRPEYAARGFSMSWPVLLPGEVREHYDPDRWPEIDEELVRIGRRAVHDELMREAGRS